MIHILTIHWKSDRWIDTQLKYLNHFIKQPFKVYAFLNGIKDVSKHQEKFFYVSTEAIKSHPSKLNLLADLACMNAESSKDYLLFLDGDAFPIASLDPFIEKTLAAYPLAAVQRKENYGDQQPHPCFCITQIDYWKRINGNWHMGDVRWNNTLGKPVGDIGGIMLRKLQQHNASWFKLLRSNQINTDHPVLFGKYHDLVYHHGAGFRSPVMRSDSNQVKFLKTKRLVFNMFAKVLPKKTTIKYFAPFQKLKKENQLLSDEMYNKIQADFNFYESL